MEKRVVELVIKQSLGWQPGETLLIVTDTMMERIAREFHDGAIALGIDATIISMAPRKNHGEEPPPTVAHAMTRCSIAILLTTFSLTHTKARKEACDVHKVRIASMPGIDPTRIERLLDIDYDAHERRCEEIAKLLDGDHTIRVTNGAGTDLTFRINRRVYRDTGRLGAAGQFGNLPCGEVCLAPIEGTASGVVVVDGSIGGVGLISEPVKIVVKEGRAVEVSDPRLRSLLAKHGDLGFSLAEFGIGTNPKAEIVGNVIEDEKAWGTAHVAFGANASMGGQVQVPVHIDCILLQPAVFVDGQVMPEKFFAFRATTKRSELPPPPSLDLDAAGTYKELFDHSNDAQYVLDLETQRFLEVNPSFEKLTGYTRDDALSGAITAPKLVARESISTFNQKRETRKYNPSERYDLKLLCKSGDKKPVELSVRRMSLKGRDVVIGSMRDLTARKQLEQEMWERIEQLGFANNRIFALTEKMKRVPDLTPKLLPVTSEDELLERGADMLCAREGLAYADVTFYLLKNDALELSFSTVKSKKRKMKLDSDSRLVKVLRGEDAGEVTKQAAVLPLKGRDRNIGVIEVSFHPKEIEVLEGNERALKGYQDLLITLSNIFGLLVDNLHLYEAVRLQSIIDQTTGVFNRRWFDAKLVEEIHRAERYGRDLSLVMIDLDHFKEVNDTWGHKEGDLVLIDSAKIFRSHTREVDIVCRIGGDEFAIIMPETSYEGAMQKSELLRRDVQEKDFTNLVDATKAVKVSLSVGVTSYTKEVKNSDDFVKTCDEALYTAKRGGRDRVVGTMAKKTGKA